MVMKRNAMRKNLSQSILRSKGRYIAISAIIALGAGLFVGLLMTKTDMVATGQKYTTQQNMFDLRAISNYGWSEEYVEEFAALDGIERAEGLVYKDLIAKEGQSDDAVYRFYAIPENLNKLALRSGRMPQTDRECLADGYRNDDSILGTQVSISSLNDSDDWDALRCHTYTVVGCVASPLYMDMNRGTTSIGSGSLQNYYYLPANCFDVDYYSEINLTIAGDYDIYTDEYNHALDAAIDSIEPAAEVLAERRFQEIKDEVEEEYNEGYQEYLDGLKEYEDGKAEAEQELADAEKELKDGEKELQDGYDKLIQAEKDIKKGKEQVEEGWFQYNQGKAAFEAMKPGALQQISEGRAALDAKAAAAKAELNKANLAVAAAQQAVDDLAGEPDDSEIKASALQALADAQAYVQAVQYGLQQIEAGYQELEAQEQKLIDAENQLKSTEAMLDASWKELEHAESKLMVSWGEWGEARDELKDGWEEYYDAKAEAEEELAEAEAELKDAEMELADAREEIDAMDAPDLILLDRNSNIGYNNLDSSSDIVAGVSRVFPVFFLLIASLVCITTMTRMIDEERTQIGTLKALGYSNGAIISKYLIYSGSGAILGCSLGVLFGCTIFPQVIWQAYNIMLYIQPNIVLTVDWALAIAVTVSYLAVMLLTTWYCCEKTLREEPAELIRPKAPDTGKKIILEKLPLWHKLSFLNKVAIRNIFRYKQRLAMMLIGIGGCTALLIAGFGLRDSIVNVVDYQFQNVTHYDLAVYFRHEPDQEEKAEFLEAIQGKTENTMFYHQSSVDIQFQDRVKELYMISGGQELETFITLRMNGLPLRLPERNEVVLSVGVAENMGIGLGDIITLRNADMQQMELTVSGIYENHVDNYAIVSGDSIRAFWGESPEMQMAYLSVPDGQEVHTVSAAVSNLDFVMNVSISEDVADMVRSMMEALDLVIVVVVMCAALLAIIVLYNLTNININERIREIATIKVLGFNAGETASYVFKENLVLTVVGSFLGLGLGRLLLEFIMSQIKIDKVWFKPVLTETSCILAVVLTLLAAAAVTVIFYFKLETINMAEALKSVE